MLIFVDAIAARRFFAYCFALRRFASHARLPPIFAFATILMLLLKRHLFRCYAPRYAISPLRYAAVAIIQRHE